MSLSNTLQNSAAAPPAVLLPAAAREALAFLIAAGCDVPVADMPRNWLETASSPAATSVLPSASAASSQTITTNEAETASPVQARTPRPPAAAPGPHPALACGDVDALLALLSRFPAARQQPPLLFHGNLASRIWVLIDRPDHDPAHRDTIDRMLAAIDLDWTRAALVSRIAWSTPGDSEPTPDLLARFTPVLARLAVLAPPRHVLAMGQAAAEMAGSAARLASSRGQWFDWAGARLLPTVHPRTMGRNKDLRAQAFEHLKLFQAAIT
ncbi:uracil-DNA glycosylase family protein [Sandarakinorhabdus sp.]|uniref:uracil-DNA glycosylase family protein n=1 Tax=Sandarakinorhabdus sp. TaxID=1916663 RepID=UPI0033422562